MKMKTFYQLVYYVLFVYYYLIGVSNCVEVTILHTNDVHARFQSYNLQSKNCNETDIRSGQCFGGAARRMTAIKKFRAEHKNVLLLDGGDQFQGTLWYTALKWNPVAAYMNKMNYTAMAFGNHEFDDGLDGLEPFASNITFPLVNSNIEVVKVETPRQNLKNSFDKFFKKYHEITIDGQSLAIIGYTAQETPDLSKPGLSLKFNEEIKSLQIVVDELESKGINKIIAIGHAGITIDRKICQQVKGVDVVIGGHTNTFLYTGTPPSVEQPEGPYPEAYTTTGNTCLVVQDYAFGKYLGHLEVTFDDTSGTVKNWKGNPILINTSYLEDPDMAALLRPYKAELETKEKTVIGLTAVALDGKTTSCRLNECNLGNLITDAILYYYLQRQWSGNEKTSNSKSWSSVGISLLNSGAVREFNSEAMTNLTLGDLYTFMPFGNTLELIKIEGKYLLEAFEYSVEDYSNVEKHGRFLQMSGVRVIYDLNNPNRRRVKSVLVRCADCEIPKYEPLNLTKVYSVVTVSYLKNGGDGYRMIKDHFISSVSAEILDVDAVLDYFKKFQPIFVGVEGRIIFSGEIFSSDPNNVMFAMGNDCYRVYCSFSLSSIVFSLNILKLFFE